MVVDVTDDPRPVDKRAACGGMSGRLGQVTHTTPASHLAVLGGWATWAEMSVRFTRREVQRAVADGSIVRLARDRYGLPTADAHLAAAGRLHGVLVGRSAAALWRFRLKTEPVLPEVAVSRGRRLSAEQRAGAHLHWRRLPDGLLAPGGQVTNALQTVLDCARTMPFDEALCIADSALRQQRVTSDELRAAAAAARGQGRTKAVRIAEAANPLAANPFESVLRALSYDVPGLSMRPQVPVRLGSTVIHPDLVDEHLGIIAEGDSYAFHTDRAQIRVDCRRYTGLTLDGWLVLRFCHDDAMIRQGDVRAAYRRAVELRQGRPFRGLTA